MNLLDLYAKLYLVRCAEMTIQQHYAENEMKTPMHMSLGQEHIAVGVLAALGERAKVFSTYRSHAAYLARTDDVEGFFKELYGVPGGPGDGRQGSMHLTNPDKGVMLSSAVVGSQLSPAVGYAFSAQLQRTKDVAVVFLGDGATETGVFWESLNAACLMKLPVLFVLEDNALAVHSLTEQRQAFKIGDVLRQLPIYYRGILDPCRATCIENVHRSTAIMQEWMDEHHRPGLLWVSCCRYLEHVGVYADYDKNYRDMTVVEMWKRLDSVEQARKALIKAVPREVAEIEEKVAERVKAAVDIARAEEFFQRPTELFK